LDEPKGGDGVTREGFLFILMVLFLPTVVKGAEWETYDKIVAKVGGEIITEMELVRKITEQNAEVPEKDNLEARNAALDRLIVEKLMLDYARERGIEPNEKDIDTSITSVMERMGLNQEGLKDFLAKEGLTYAAYKHQVKMQILQSRILNREMASEGPPDDETLKNYYETHKQEFLEPPKVHLSQIVLLTPKGLSQKELEKKAALILEIKKGVQNGEDFTEFAKQYSEDPSAQKGGDIGSFGPGELMPELEKEIAGKAEGELIGPFRSDLGFHLVKLEKRLPSSVLPFEKVKEEVKRGFLAENQQERFENWIKKAKRDTYIEVLK
jgi:parvulin-like peptidyl-prolyl isomerase